MDNPTKVRQGSFITIQNFMVKDLKLKGNELLVYAIIYGFSQDGKSRFTGSLQYLCDWTASSKQGIMKTLKSLLSKQLVNKQEKQVNGIKFCTYATQLHGIQQSFTGYATQFHEVCNSVSRGMQLSCPNNIEYNIDYNILNNIDIPPISPTGDQHTQKPNKIDQRFETFWQAYPKKIGKGAAQKAFAKIKPSQDLLDTMLRSIQASKASEQWAQQQGQFIPNPATWLNQSRWEDEPPAPTQTTTTTYTQYDYGF